MRRLCIFCGSKKGNNPIYVEESRRMGRLLAERGLGLVFGGGHIGLMGVVADALLEQGGEVIGVIPDTLSEKELAHQGVSTLHVVPSMHARKALMEQLADAFVALPGGYGTGDEFFEILTWRQLGIHNKPVALFNVNGFFNPLLNWIDHMVDEGFVKAKNRNLVHVSESPTQLLEMLFPENNTR